MSKVLLITGATGKQGGAVIQSLLASPHAADFTILAVTRNPESGSAKRLADKGVKLVQGDLNDTPAIFESAKKVLGEGRPIWGVFSVQIPLGSGASTKTEEAQGKALVDVALAAGVKFFIYTSVDRGGDDKSFDAPTNIPHFISKYNIEHHLVDKAGDKMQWFIIRPVAFMENFTNDFTGKAMHTTFKVSQKEKPFQLVSIKDIGEVAAKAFINPEQFAGTGLGLAGDSVSFDQMAKTFKYHVGTEIPTTLGIVGKAIIWTVGDVGPMMKWFYSDGYGADIKKVKAIHPGLLNYEDWLKTESNWAKRE